MAGNSERRLQTHLHENGFYTQKAPDSGSGITDPETGDRIDQADIIAIRGDPSQSFDAAAGASRAQILIVEEKHAAPDVKYIQDEEIQQVKRIQRITGGVPLIAVQWKSTHYPHDFFRLDDLQRAGENWKVTTEMDGRKLHDITQ